MNKLKQRIFKKLKNTYCRIGRSKIEGVGVVAIRPIPKNTNIFYGLSDPRAVRFKLIELKQLNAEVLKMIDDFLCLETDNTVLIPEYGLNGLNISFFLNYSNRPNVKTIDGGENFVTLRQIKAGEELTVLYKTYDKINASQWRPFKKPNNKKP